LSFEKAGDMDTEPCQKHGGCPFNGRIPKGKPVYFCSHCMESMAVNADNIDWEL